MTALKKTNCFSCNILDFLWIILLLTLFPCRLIFNVQYGIKFFISIIVFLYLVGHLPRKLLINNSCCFPICIILSGLLNFFLSDYYSFIDLLNSLVYSLLFYDVYTLAILYKKRKAVCRLYYITYKVLGVFVLLSIISIFLYDNNLINSNSIYFFGSKFITIYIMIFFITMYLISSKCINKILFFIYILFAIYISLYIKCGTGTVILVVYLLMCLIPTKIKKVLMDKKKIIISFILSGCFVYFATKILNMQSVHNFVYGLFNRSTTVTGRLLIYSEYLFKVINNHLFFGNGYNNYLMSIISNNYFANAQNGMFQIVLDYGITGLISLLFIIYTSTNKLCKGVEIFPFYSCLYALILAGIFEISINWVFFITLAFIHVYNDTSVL